MFIYERIFTLDPSKFNPRPWLTSIVLTFEFGTNQTQGTQPEALDLNSVR